MFYQQTYEKTLMKQFENEKKDHAQKQMQQIENVNNHLGKSHILEKWDDKELLPLDDEEVKPSQLGF